MWLYHFFLFMDGCECGWILRSCSLLFFVYTSMHLSLLHRCGNRRSPFKLLRIWRSSHLLIWFALWILLPIFFLFWTDNGPLGFFEVGVNLRGYFLDLLGPQFFLWSSLYICSPVTSSMLVFLPISQLSYAWICVIPCDYVSDLLQIKFTSSLLCTEALSVW